MSVNRFLAIATVLVCTLAAAPALCQDGQSPQPARRNKPRAAQQQNPALRVGEYAPTFTLLSLDGETKTELKRFRGQKPVLLLFGSYT